MKGHPVRKAYWSAYTLYHARHEARLPFRPLDEVMALQNRRVRAIVAHAYDSVSYYRDVMNAAGLHPRDFRTADDFARLPVLSAKDVASAPQRFLSGRFPTGRILEVRSSGTSGYAKSIFYDPAALFLSLAHGHRQRHVLAPFVGKAHGYRELHVVRERSVAHQVRAFYESHSWVPGKIELTRAFASSAARFEDTIAAVNAFNPDVVRGYGSHLGALFRFASTHQLALHRPKCVVYGADRMADADRAVIEREFGVPVLSTYQAAEAFRIGFQCAERKSFHLSIDHAAVRVVDPQGHPVGPGGTGQIVISNLVNRATVLLNYKIGDIVTMGSGPCACGRTLPTIEAIDGRADDFVTRDGGHTIHGLVVLAPLLRVPGVVQVQLIQEAIERFVLKVVTARDSSWPSVSRELDAALRSTLGNSFVVEIERSDTIAPETSGKFRSVISRCGT